MKAIGIVRKVDQLGRVVLPKELRTTMDIKTEDPLEIFVDGDSIILRKYEPACTFCGEGRGVKLFRGKNICQDCLSEIKK